MPEPLRVAIVLHLDLPPGTSPAEADRIWREAHAPLLGALHHIPGARAGVVLAADVQQEIEQNHPEGIEWMRGLLERGQIELVATALYEPVLSAVPERDAVGQLQAHATASKKTFGVRPTGAWLPHGVWDPVIPRIFAAADLGWTLIDDRIVEPFVTGGANGVWRIERDGSSVAVLAVDARVRDVSPGANVRQVLGHLQRVAQRGHRLVVLAFNAERFSDKRDQSWIATLIATLARNPDMRLVLPSAAVAETRSRGRLYLPCAGPRETLVPWERTLVRYEEANRLHKRMIRASRLVERLDRSIRDGDTRGFRPDPSALVQARRYLYRAQGAGAYGHFAVAGLYDPRRRALAWRDVLRAEKVCNDALQVEERVLVETIDLDCDGTEDVVLRTRSATIVIDRVHTAGLVELSIGGVYRNVFDTLTRLREPYHDQLEVTSDGEPTNPGVDDESTLSDAPRILVGAERPEFRKAIAFDRAPRVAFVHHVIGPEVTVNDLWSGALGDLAPAFRDRPWELVSAERFGEGGARAAFELDGPVGGRQVKIAKRYTLQSEPVLEARIELTNLDHDTLRARFAVELDFALTGGQSLPEVVIGGRRISPGRPEDHGDAERFLLEGPDLSCEVVCKRPCRLWTYPIETVHRHQGAFEIGQQGVCVVLVWPIELFPQERARCDVRLAFTSIGAR